MAIEEILVDGKLQGGDTGRARTAYADDPAEFFTPKRERYMVFSFLTYSRNLRSYRTTPGWDKRGFLLTNRLYVRAR